jgi:molybdopterin-guanine dinucleotide biosynthesis protein A
VGGVLLTGGRSSRLGFDKTLIEAGGETLAMRLGRRLAAVVEIAVEVGPAKSGLEPVSEGDPRQGPLVALLAGVRRLREKGHHGHVIALASDMPGVGEGLLSYMAGHPSKRSVMPIYQGVAQVLCARYSAGDLDRLEVACGSGERSLRAALSVLDAPVMLAEADWVRVAGPFALFDVDTRHDLHLARARGML